MNLALWVERAGKSHPQRAAAGTGDRTLRTFGEPHASRLWRARSPIGTVSNRVTTA
jgi:hypothetical protein